MTALQTWMINGLFMNLVLIYFLIKPVRLVNVTNAFRIALGKWKRQRYDPQTDSVAVVPSNGAQNTPPIPIPKASVILMTRGLVGIISQIWVVVSANSRTIQWKLSRKSCTILVSLICLWSFLKRNCSALNSPRVPGNATATDRSSPSTRCHFWTEIRSLVLGNSSRMSSSHWLCPSSCQLDGHSYCVQQPAQVVLPGLWDNHLPFPTS